MLLSVDGHEVWTHFTGVFNASNLLAVTGAAILLGADHDEMLRIWANCVLSRVALKLFVRRKESTPLLIMLIRPMPLKCAFRNYRNTYRQRAGDYCCRSRWRPRQDQTAGNGGEAVKQSDRVILTSDNPRLGRTWTNAADMEVGVEAHQKHKSAVGYESQRSYKTACMLARPGDIILVAGKGHEDYQEIKGGNIISTTRKWLTRFLETIKNKRYAFIICIGFLKIGIFQVLECCNISRSSQVQQLLFHCL